MYYLFNCMDFPPEHDLVPRCRMLGDGISEGAGYSSPRRARRSSKTLLWRCHYVTHESHPRRDPVTLQAAAVPFTRDDPYRTLSRSRSCQDQHTQTSFTTIVDSMLGHRKYVIIRDGTRRAVYCEEPRRWNALTYSIRSTGEVS